MSSPPEPLTLGTATVLSVLFPLCTAVPVAVFLCVIWRWAGPLSDSFHRMLSLLSLRAVVVMRRVAAAPEPPRLGMAPYGVRVCGHYTHVSSLTFFHVSFLVSVVWASWVFGDAALLTSQVHYGCLASSEKPGWTCRLDSKKCALAFWGLLDDDPECAEPPLADCEYALVGAGAEAGAGDSDGVTDMLGGGVGAGAGNSAPDTTPAPGTNSGNSTVSPDAARAVGPDDRLICYRLVPATVDSLVHATVLAAGCLFVFNGVGGLSLWWASKQRRMPWCPRRVDQRVAQTRTLQIGAVLALVFIASLAGRDVMVRQSTKAMATGVVLAVFAVAPVLQRLPPIPNHPAGAAPLRGVVDGVARAPPAVPVANPSEAV